MDENTNISECLSSLFTMQPTNKAQKDHVTGVKGLCMHACVHSLHAHIGYASIHSSLFASIHPVDDGKALLDTWMLHG